LRIEENPRRRHRYRDATKPDYDVIVLGYGGFGVLFSGEISIGGGEREKRILVVRIEPSGGLQGGSRTFKFLEAKLGESQSKHEIGRRMRIEPHGDVDIPERVSGPTRGNEGKRRQLVA